MENSENLIIVFFVLIVLAAIAGLGYALWKPVLSRAWRYFVTWWERDKIAEAEARRLRECRERAEAEISGDADAMCQQPISAEDLAAAQECPQTTSEPAPMVQQVKR